MLILGVLVCKNREKSIPLWFYFLTITIKAMKNIFTPEKLEKFRELTTTAEQIAIVSHTNPDGDAIGSGLGMLRALRSIDPTKTVRFITPNDMSDSLRLVDTDRDCESFMGDIQGCTAFLAAADLIIILDFNDPARLDRMGQAMERNLSAQKIMIDHHMSPLSYDLDFHDADSSSTAFLVFSLFDALGLTITRQIGEPLYLGMMTDTGRFMHGHLTPELFRAVGRLVEWGVDPRTVNLWIYNHQTESKVRLTGHLLSNNLTIMHQKHCSIMTLSEQEKEQFNYKIGDTEGIVNIPLSIEGITMSVFVVENRDHLKLSFRSEGDVDVNAICREHFGGGGHKNASGGRFLGSMTEVVDKLNEIIATLNIL